MESRAGLNVLEAEQTGQVGVSPAGPQCLGLKQAQVGPGRVREGWENLFWSWICRKHFHGGIKSVIENMASRGSTLFIQI